MEGLQFIGLFVVLLFVCAFSFLIMWLYMTKQGMDELEGATAALVIEVIVLCLILSVLILKMLGVDIN